MLSDDERREIEAELARYAHKQAGAIDALMVVQRHRGWVSDEGLRDAAPLVGMSPDELDGVATFYNMIFRQPVGRHVILICDSVSCWVMGYRELRRGLEACLGVGLGQTTPDGRFTLLPNVCLGACDRAPAMMIDGDFYGNVDAGQLHALLDRYK